MVNLFEKSTGAERVPDTIFSKHKYLTKPTVSPEVTIVAAAQQLTSASKDNEKGNHVELEVLTKVADLFEEISRDKAEIVRQGKLTGNGVQQYADASSKVENSKLPRVDDSKLPGWTIVNFQGCPIGWLLRVWERLLYRTIA